MAKRSWQQKLESAFDAGAAPMFQRSVDGASVEEQRAYWAFLTTVRSAVREEGAPVLSEGQMPAFMDGIHERLDADRNSFYRGRPILATLSLTFAALMIALATFVSFRLVQVPVEASTVEYVETDLDDATVNHTGSPDGHYTVVVNFQSDDL